MRFLHACRAYLVKDWDQLVRHTETLVDDPLLGIEAGLFGGMARVRLEMYTQAEPLLSASLMRCRSEQPQRKELRYWLARAHEGTGRSAAALPLYRAVHRIDPAFMDTAARLAAIAEYDGFEGYDGVDDPAGLATVALGTLGGGLGQDAVDTVPGAEPDAGGLGDGLLLAPEPVPPAAPVTPPETVRQKAPLPGQPMPPRFPAGPTDPALLAEALAELEGMVGLEPVKRQVKALSAQLEMARLRAGQGLPVQPPKRHFVFSGPSGTGKTTVARILGRVFYALGLLGGDHLVEAQRADMVGEFLGQTAVKANELIDSAVGGVLFVDEAYALSNTGYSKGDAYGDEALQVLLKRAEDNRDHLVVILAGYPEGMDRLLSTNPGLSSRFTTRVDFPRTGRWSSPPSARSSRRPTGTAGTRRPGTSSGRSAGTSSSRAGSTSSATAASCGPCTRSPAPTGTCGSPGTRRPRPGRTSRPSGSPTSCRRTARCCRAAVRSTAARSRSPRGTRACLSGQAGP